MLNQGHVYREQIGADAAGRTVLEWLSSKHRHSTREVWAERIERGEVEIDGLVVGGDRVLLAGESLAWHRPGWVEPEVPVDWRVLFEDEVLVAVHKPSGLPTLPGGGFLENTLLAFVRAKYPDASPMHRLGRETSGLVLFARTQQARGRLQEAWRGHEVKKTYRALGAGVCLADTLELTTPIGPVAHPLLGTIHAASPTGKPSRSHARVLERREEATLFAVEIETGRPHQIRIHLAAAGHPLVGDPIYVAGGIPRDDQPGLPGDGGYLLHAEWLSFLHPTTGRPLTLHDPPPAPLLRQGE